MVTCSSCGLAQAGVVGYAICVPCRAKSVFEFTPLVDRIAKFQKRASDWEIWVDGNAMEFSAMPSDRWRRLCSRHAPYAVAGGGEGALVRK